MKVRVFTVRFDRETGAFDDTALQQFLETHDATAVSEHVVTVDGEPTLLLMVQWRPSAGERGAPSDADRRARGEDPRSTLSPEEQAAYDALRTWRNDRARRLGKPAYQTFTNQQMVLLVRQRPSTLTALAEIAGIGEARTAEFGGELLGVLAGLPAVGTPSAAAAER